MCFLQEQFTLGTSNVGRNRFMHQTCQSCTLRAPSWWNRGWGPDGPAYQWAINPHRPRENLFKTYVLCLIAQNHHWEKWRYLERSLSLSLQIQEEGSSPLDTMISAIVLSGSPVKSQQLGEPDLTVEEKKQLLMEQFNTKPVVFLERYHTHLKPEHLEAFSHVSSDCRTQYYCTEVQKRASSSANKTRVRNHRYAALRALQKGRCGEFLIFWIFPTSKFKAFCFATCHPLCCGTCISTGKSPML